MEKRIGPTFADELRAAGVSLNGYTWGDDGSIEFADDVPQATRDAVLAVLAVHQPNKPPSAQESFAAIEGALQASLDAAARARGYDDIRSAISYRGSTNPTWAHEADVFFAWRDAVWEKALAFLADVQAGKAPLPTPDEALALIPPLVF